MTTTVFFTLDVDPSFPWRSDIQGLKEFLGCLKQARHLTDFFCEMNISGYALIQISKISQKLLDQLKELVAAHVIEIGNHGYTHRPLSIIETSFSPRRYIEVSKLVKHIQTVIYKRQTTESIRISIRHAINLFLTKPNALMEGEIIKEIRVTNKLLEKAFNHPPQIFRAPYLSTSQLISKIIREEGIKCDLSNYITTKGNKLQAVIPRNISEGNGEIWEIDTSAKLDPSRWIEKIATYKPGLLPTGLTVVVTHPWEFSLSNKSAGFVRKSFQHLLGETDKFVLVGDIIK
ncbi:MAG: polysaccharide deacetylase family protein [Promethearchaeota archaeon]